MRNRQTDTNAHAKCCTPSVVVCKSSTDGFVSPVLFVVSRVVSIRSPPPSFVVEVIDYEVRQTNQQLRVATKQSSVLHPSIHPAIHNHRLSTQLYYPCSQANWFYCFKNSHLMLLKLFYTASKCCIVVSPIAYRQW